MATKSFAQRALEIEKKFEGRFSPEAKRTKKSLMEDLRAEQERAKALFQNAPTMENQNQAKEGGLFGNVTGDQMNGYLGAASTALDLGQTAFGKPNIDTSGNTEITERTNVGMGAASGALKGASAGTMIMPGIGTAVGAIVGGAAGFLGGKKAADAEQLAISNTDKRKNVAFSPDTYQAAYGGKLNKYDGTGPSLMKKDGPLWKDLDLSTSLQKFGDANKFSDLKGAGAGTWGGKQGAGFGTYGGNGNQNLIPDYTPGNAWSKTNPNNGNNLQDKATYKKPGFLEKGANWLGKNAGNIAQYAQIAGALTNKINRAPDEISPKLEGTVNLDRIDEKRMRNAIAGGYNVAGAASEGAGGSLSLYNTLAKSKELAKLKAIGGGEATTRQSNLQQGNIEAGMQQRQDMFNAQAGARDNEVKAQNEGAFQTARQNRRQAIFDSAANVGREEVDKNIVKEMYGYKWNGKYWVDPKGKKVSEAEYKNAIATNQKQMQSMFGGYLKK
jgi:hypothetical protein